MTDFVPLLYSLIKTWTTLGAAVTSCCKYSSSSLPSDVQDNNIRLFRPISTAPWPNSYLARATNPRRISLSPNGDVRSIWIIPSSLYAFYAHSIVEVSFYTQSKSILTRVGKIYIFDRKLRFHIFLVNVTLAVSSSPVILSLVAVPFLGDIPAAWKRSYHKFRSCKLCYGEGDQTKKVRI